MQKQCHRKNNRQPISGYRQNGPPETVEGILGSFASFRSEPLPARQCVREHLTIGKFQGTPGGQTPG